MKRVRLIMAVAGSTAWQLGPPALRPARPTVIGPPALGPARATAIAMNFMQAKPVEVGQRFPDMNAIGGGVEVVTDDCAMEDMCEVVDTDDNLLTSGRTVLVGMPGAFTPTCTDEHLPGFVRNARKFKRLGVDALAVITTNDKFIMQAWKRAMRSCVEQEGLKSIDSEMHMLADKDGNLIRALGLAYAETLDRNQKNAFIQFNAGMRSKRFALVVDKGVVQHVAIDEGSIDLDVTSAEAILSYLQPAKGPAPLPSKASTDDDDGAGKAALLLAAVAAAGYYYVTVLGSPTFG
jgi:peroxiredoxin